MDATDAATASNISADAGIRFAAIAEPRVAACADDLPFTVEELGPYIADGRAWVATDDEPVAGFLIADIVDGAVHIEEVDVARDHGRRGHGSALVDAASKWAAAGGYNAMTLTTFRDVPWNAPWYARRGFRVLPEEELTPELNALRDRENAAGLPSELRVVMRLDLAHSNARQHLATKTNDETLYERGVASLLASWATYAVGAAGAALHRHPGVVAAVFPAGAERLVYNNALLERGFDGNRCAAAIDAMEAAYAGAGVDRFAAWVHESDDVLGFELKRRGYTVDTSTLAMGMYLDDLAVPRPDLDLAFPAWDDYLRIFELPAGLLKNADRRAFHVLVALLNDEPVTTAMSFDFDGDCGIYNVGTVERARRRGLGTAMTALQLHGAVERGCRTASLQSTPMAERVYSAAGFSDLGRIYEYVPAVAR